MQLPLDLKQAQERIHSPYSMTSKNKSTWDKPRHHSKDDRSWKRSLLTGAAAGVAATLISGGVNSLLKRFVSEEQKRREQKVRKGSPHQSAGPILAKRMTHHELSENQKKMARAGFSIVYGILWGGIHAAVRRKLPGLFEAKGLPLGGTAFFLACDGAIAPLLKLTPGLPRIPWQFNAKELTNHLVWTATAELIQKADERFAAQGGR